MSATTPARTVPQVSLPGQAAAPEGPVDLAIMYVVHHAFRRDLADFAETVPATPAGDRAAWRHLQARWERFFEVLHKHHTGEDAGLWPALLDAADAAGDAAGRETLEAMEAEHATIDPLLAACAEGFARMAAGGDDDDRAGLAARLASTRNALGRHLAHEETDALALVQRYLSPQQWHDIDQTYFVKKYSPRELFFLVPWATKGLPEDVRRSVLASAGLPFRLLEALARPSFARGERRAFGRH